MSEISQQGAAERAAPSAPPAEVLDVVSDCPLPCLLLAVPSAVILAASPVAQHLLCPSSGSPVGRNFEEFTDDRPTGALELVAGGHLDGYEARRTIRRGDGSVPMTVWIRRVHGQGGRDFALMKLLPDPSTLGEALQRPKGTTAEAVVGSTDVHLVVDRISPD